MANLFHYTTFEGLKGILENQCLWATDYKTMNDARELRFARKFLDKFISEYASKSCQLSALLGDKEINKKHDENILNVSVQNKSFNSLINTIPFFITSFCEHNRKEIAKDGLLSQWRGYGVAGDAYAVEFNDSFYSLIATLDNLFKKKSFILSGDDNKGLAVEYIKYVEDDGIIDISLFEEAFSSQLKKIKEIAEGADSTTIVREIIPKIYAQCKHYGFHEEKERRLILAPWHTEKNYPIKTSQRHDGVLRNYIELFKDVKNNLFIKSIKRILVGPSLHKENNAEKIRTMLSQLEEVKGEGYKKIIVETSTIPYV